MHKVIVKFVDGSEQVFETASEDLAFNGPMLTIPLADGSAMILLGQVQFIRVQASKIAIAKGPARPLQ